MVILVYVDDMLLDGRESHIKSFLSAWHKRFGTTEAEWLSEGNPVDFCGIIIAEAGGAACCRVTVAALVPRNPPC